MWKESQTQTHASRLTNILSQTLLPRTQTHEIWNSVHPNITIFTTTFTFCVTAHLASYRNKLFTLFRMTAFLLYGHTQTQLQFFPPYPTALEHGQAKAHFSGGDALSSRGVHMKEQRNIKECPRIHCSAQCEDNLALMENLDQRPGLHNCTFPNKRCAIWRVGQTSGLLRPAPARRHTQPRFFHLAMFSISMSW